MNRDWFIQIPVYVTRKNADGVIATFSLSAVWCALVMLLVLFNVILWGVVGLYEGVRVFTG